MLMRFLLIPFIRWSTLSWWRLCCPLRETPSSTSGWPTPSTSWPPAARRPPWIANRSSPSSRVWRNSWPTWAACSALNNHWTTSLALTRPENQPMKDWPRLLCGNFASDDAAWSLGGASSLNVYPVFSGNSFFFNPLVPVAPACPAAPPACLA